MFIGIDSTQIDFLQVQPFTHEGVHSGEELRGMELIFVSRSGSEDEQIEALIRKEGTVAVSDPTGGQYEGRIDRNWSSSQQQGGPVRRYWFTIREVDRAKPFAALQIEGETFTVLRNTETVTSSGEIGIHVLLKLSPEEFTAFLPLLKPGPVNMLRVGVDKGPIERRFGAVVDWSYHEDDSGAYYKQAVNFYDPNPPSQGLFIL